MSDQPPKVYLAGPIASPEDGGHHWRDMVTARYGSDFAFLNPLEKYDVGAPDVEIVDSDPTPGEEITVTELVESDREMVDAADAVLVGWTPVVSVGTPMEAMLAYETETPLAVWDRDDALRSPWWRYHADYIGSDVADCLDYLDDELEVDG